jgi:hypothetical protein
MARGCARLLGARAPPPPGCSSALPARRTGRARASTRMRQRPWPPRGAPGARTWAGRRDPSARAAPRTGSVRRAASAAGRRGIGRWSACHGCVPVADGSTRACRRKGFHFDATSSRAIRKYSMPAGADGACIQVTIRPSSDPQIVVQLHQLCPLVPLGACFPSLETTTKT